MTRLARTSIWPGIALSAGVFALCLLVALAFGPASLSLGEVWRFVTTGPVQGDLPNAIFWQIRLPRVLVACLVGAELAVAGVILQDDAGHRQLGSHEAGDEHARQADLPEDRVGKVALDRPRGDEAPDFAERQRGRSEGQRDEKARHEDASGQGDARPDACAPQTRHCAAAASGWIILTSACRP